MKKMFLLLFCFLSIASFASNKKIDKSKEAKAMEWLNNQQLKFIENKGQITDSDGKPAENVLFKTSFGNCDIYITNKGLSYVFIKYEKKESKQIIKKELRFGVKEEDCKKPMFYRLDMNLEDATIDGGNIIMEEESTRGYNNYFYAHCPQGIYGVKGYGKITLKNIYKGIDWVIYSNGNSKEYPLKYDFVVHPQADYKDIKIKFLNAQSTGLAENDTKLKIQTIAGNIEEGNLLSYLQDNSEKEAINSNYLINKDGFIEFEVGNYDKTKTLIIDPLVWATYYGGDDWDSFKSICVDNQNNIFIAGISRSINFPTQQLAGAYWQATIGGGTDIIILKFNSQGVRQWATYYGGNNEDWGFSVCADSEDNIFITGYTQSPDFPTQQAPGAYWQPALAGSDKDIFILKFNNQGVRQWATFYGGGNSDETYSNSMCLDSQDNIYITGITCSSNFPTQQLPGAYWQPNFTAYSFNAFILKFTNKGIRQWATYYGGNTHDYGASVCADHQDNIFISGYTQSPDFPTQQLTGAYWQATLAGEDDAFILKFNNQGVRQWATFYGGSDDEYEHGSSCVDSQNNIYITGQTRSADFPTQQLTGAYWQATHAGADDLFILKFNDQGVRQWATYYGGTVNELIGSISADSLDNIYFIGSTNSSDFPTQQLAGEYWQANMNGTQDAFILMFNNQCVRQWATYFGSSDYDCGTDIGFDNQNSVYFIGDTFGSGINTIDPGNGAYYDDSWNGAWDGYILKNNTFPVGLSDGNSDEYNGLSSPIPNPANRYTRIDYKLPVDVSVGELVFYDALGKEVKRFKVNRGSTNLQLKTSEYTAGAYYYNLQILGKTTGGKKLLVIK